MHCHQYHCSSHETYSDTSNNVCLDLHNCRYSRYQSVRSYRNTCTTRRDQRVLDISQFVHIEIPVPPDEIKGFQISVSSFIQKYLYHPTRSKGSRYQSFRSYRNTCTTRRDQRVLDISQFVHTEIPVPPHEIKGTMSK